MLIPLDSVLREIVTLGNESARQGAGLAPHTLSCGCCYAGCICVTHASPDRGIPAQLCPYHKADAISELAEVSDIRQAGGAA